MSDLIPQISSLDKMPLSAQALHVLKQFRSAKSQSDYMTASARWSQIRPQLQKYESDVSCKESGSASDTDIALSVLEDISKAPLALIVSLSQLVLSFSGREKDDFLEAIKKTYEEAVKLGLGKATDKMSESAKIALDKSLESLRESLLRYLQSISKRSRKHFAVVIDSAIGTLRGLGGAVAMTAKLIVDSTKITPEWCGLLKEVEEAERAAYARAFSFNARPSLKLLNCIA